jgi:hypothetical protein
MGIPHESPTLISLTLKLVLKSPHLVDIYFVRKLPSDRISHELPDQQHLLFGAVDLTFSSTRNTQMPMPGYR